MFQDKPIEVLKKILSKCPPRKPPSQVIPAAIVNRRYIGGIKGFLQLSISVSNSLPFHISYLHQSEITTYIKEGTISDIAKGKISIGTKIFREVPDEPEDLETQNPPPQSSTTEHKPDNETHPEL